MKAIVSVVIFYCKKDKRRIFKSKCVNFKKRLCKWWWEKSNYHDFAVPKGVSTGTSEIWKHFVKVDQIGGVCNICSVQVLSRQGTSNLFAYMKNVHGKTVPKQSKSPTVRGQKIVSRSTTVSSSPYQKQSPASKSQPTLSESVKKQLSFRGKIF